MLLVGALALLLARAQEAPGEGVCPGNVSEAARAEARLLLEAAQEHLRAEEWATAEESLRQAAALDPGSPFPHYALGRALMDQQRYVEAVSAYRACREAFRCLREADPEAQKQFEARLDREIQELRTGVAELERQRLKRSVIPWQEMNGSAPPNLGQTTQAMHQLEQMLSELQRLRRNPDREPTSLALALGSAHFMANDLEAAELELRRALAAEPGNGDAHNNLAVVLLATGRIGEAEREMKAAEKAGVQVAPRLKDEIRARKKKKGGQVLN